MAFTISIRLSARRNLLSAKSSSRRQASMQAAVLRDASASRGRASADSPESIDIRLHQAQLLLVLQNYGTFSLMSNTQGFLGGAQQMHGGGG